MKSRLAKVVAVDQDKCTNCHACITACPVKYCNDGSGDYVDLNSDLCIACGSCIDACTHDARYGLDDFDDFLEDLNNNQNIIAIVAPATAANFPGLYKNLNGWLKSIGISGIFDVSFGAELTIKSYMEYMQANNPKCIISQPCPAIVTYIELYRPELLKYLAPADSPMVHTIKMIKEYYPQYRNHKVMVVSPCLAKKREFLSTGFGDYNVTYLSLDNYFNEKNIDLKDFPETDFINKSAERAVLFSSPGGLMLTAEREDSQLPMNTRKIEGPHSIYPYLDRLIESIQSGTNRKLIDCLNCEMGCNGGTGTLSRNLPQDYLEGLIVERTKEMQAKYRKKGPFKSLRSKQEIKKTINSYWNPHLYIRNYLDRTDNNYIKKPSIEEMEEINHSMLKYSEEDMYNCSSCGYGNCEGMAIAIYNGLNKAENCHFYKQSIINDALKESESMQKLIEEKHDLINHSLQQAQEMKDIIEDKHDANLEMSRRLARNISDIDSSNVKVLRMAEKLLDVFTEQNEEFNLLQKDLDRFAIKTNQFENIVKTISFITERINLLSINASIESARAGEIGMRFKVVSSEIKELANKSKEEGNKISKYADEVKKEFDRISKLIQVASLKFDSTSRLVNEVTDATKKMKKSTGELNNDANRLMED